MDDPMHTPMHAALRASPVCLALIAQFEGFRAAPYLCPAGVPTIGFGSTRYEDGRAVQLSDAPISLERAQQIVLAVLQSYEDAVKRYVQVPLGQAQFDALVDFAYNAGVQNLRTSTLLRKLNAQDYAGAASEFARWVYANGKKLTGLVRRREAERALFLQQLAPAPATAPAQYPVSTPAQYPVSTPAQYPASTPAQPTSPPIFT